MTATNQRKGARARLHGREVETVPPKQWMPPRHLWNGKAVRNITFDPNYDTLPNACREAEERGFALVRVVPVSDRQSVAVFERVDSGSPEVGS